MSIPTVKLEGDDLSIKMSPSPSATSDAYMDDVDDDPELNFESINTRLWSTKLPKYLYDALAAASDTDEIEIGTIRVEGTLDQPSRISLLLANPTPTLEREYLLKAPTRVKAKPKSNSFVFSEKDTAGFKRTNIWDQVDEDGNPGQGRSQLYEQALRDEKKKENKGKFVPFARKPIPKITKMEGTVIKEFEVVPVQNQEAREKHARRTETLLKRKEMDDIGITNKIDPRAQVQSIMTAAERADMNKAVQKRKQDAKDNRNARLDKTTLVVELLKSFREHRYWGLRDLRTKLRQPESWVKENLEEIAIMHRHGDFNGKWELKDHYKNDDELMNATGEAPKMDDSDIDMAMKSEDDDEFEDVA